MIQGSIDLNDGGRLYCTVAGEGEPLILLHGNFNDHQIWDEQVDVFAARYHVIRYDLRGYGHSSMPISSFSPVEDLKALIDSLKLQGVTLIGSSSGGGVAVDFTLTYPHLVHKLVLVAPSINGIPFPIHMMWQGTKNFFNVRMKGRSSAIESFIRNHYWNYYFPSRDKELARSLVLKNVRNLNNFCRFPPQLSSVMKPSSATRLQDIHIPTLVIISDQEHPYNMKTAETLHHHIKHSSKISMQGCGHLPFIEEPQEFNHIVLEFLSNRSL